MNGVGKTFIGGVIIGILAGLLVMLLIFAEYRIIMCNLIPCVDEENGIVYAEVFGLSDVYDYKSITGGFKYEL